MPDLLEEYPSLILGLEAVTALLLLVFIVWWTSRGAGRSRDEDED